MKTKRWKPTLNEIYYSILIDAGAYTGQDNWDDTETDEYYYKSGNCYRTRAEANKKLKLIKAILKQP